MVDVKTEVQEMEIALEDPTSVTDSFTTEVWNESNDSLPKRYFVHDAPFSTVFNFKGIKISEADALANIDKFYGTKIKFVQPSPSENGILIGFENQRVLNEILRERFIVYGTLVTKIPVINSQHPFLKLELSGVPIYLRNAEFKSTDDVIQTLKTHIGRLGSILSFKGCSYIPSRPNLLTSDYTAIVSPDPYFYSFIANMLPERIKLFNRNIILRWTEIEVGNSSFEDELLFNDELDSIKLAEITNQLISTKSNTDIVVSEDSNGFEYHPTTNWIARNIEPSDSKSVEVKVEYEGVMPQYIRKTVTKVTPKAIQSYSEAPRPSTVGSTFLMGNSSTWLKTSNTPFPIPPISFDNTVSNVSVIAPHIHSTVPFANIPLNKNFNRGVPSSLTVRPNNDVPYNPSDSVNQPSNDNLVRPYSVLHEPGDGYMLPNWLHHTIVQGVNGSIPRGPYNLHQIGFKENRGCSMFHATTNHPCCNRATEREDSLNIYTCNLHKPKVLNALRKLHREAVLHNPELYSNGKYIGPSTSVGATNAHAPRPPSNYHVPPNGHNSSNGYRPHNSHKAPHSHTYRPY